MEKSEKLTESLLVFPPPRKLTLRFWVLVREKPNERQAANLMTFRDRSHLPSVAN